MGPHYCKDESGRRPMPRSGCCAFTICSSENGLFYQVRRALDQSACQPGALRLFRFYYVARCEQERAMAESLCCGRTIPTFHHGIRSPLQGQGWAESPAGTMSLTDPGKQRERFSGEFPTIGGLRVGQRFTAIAYGSLGAGISRRRKSRRSQRCCSCMLARVLRRWSITPSQAANTAAASG